MVRSIALESGVKDRKVRLKSCYVRDASLQNEAQLVLLLARAGNQLNQSSNAVIKNLQFEVTLFLSLINKTFTSLLDKKDNSNIIPGQEIKIKTSPLFELRYVSSHVALPFPPGEG